MRVISLTTGKMVPGLVTIMEMTTNLSILSHNLRIFKQCIKSEVNVVVNRQFICLYNSLKQIMGEIYVNFIELCMEGDYFLPLQESKSCTTCSFIIKVGNVQMVYFQEVVSYTFLLWVIPIMKNNM